MTSLRGLRAALREGNLEPWGPRSLASLFGSGSVLVAASCLLPGRSAPGFALAAAAVAAMTAALLWRARHVSLAVLNVVLGLGTVLVALVVYSSGQATSPDALLFVWVALFGGYFLGTRAVVAHIAGIAVSYAVVLSALEERPGPDASPQNFLLVVGAVAVAGAWVAFLRGIVDELIGHQVRVARADGLTGLTNRGELLRRGDAELARRRRQGGVVGVLLIDLDEFKLVNDGMGHAAGDRLLQLVGERLTGAIRGEDVVARLGGDEFAVLVAGGDDVAGLDDVAERILGALRAPFGVGGELVEVEASVGIAVADAHASLEELLRDADLAMYAAKAAGGGPMRFADEMQRELSERRELLRDLRRAVAEQALTLHFQPIRSVRSLAPVAVEALTRWRHPERGMIGPDQFIPMAESSGLIVALGRWVLDQACAHAAGWAGPAAEVMVSVNLSPRQLLDPHLVDDVRRALDDHGLSPGRLMLEITETSVMNDPEAAMARLHELRALGVSLAVDDFGTGYSSLAYLRRLPVSDLKLARPFVRDLEDSPSNLALARGIIELTHTLGMRVIAEGVEDPSQLERLRGMGCDLVQGFLFDRPMIAGELVERLERQAPLGADLGAAVEHVESAALTAAGRRALLDTLPAHAYAVFDRDLRWVALGGQALERAGWRLEHLAGRRPADVFGADRARVLEAKLSAALDGVPQTLHWPSVRGPCEFAVELRPLYDTERTGGLAGVVALVRESATRRRAT